MEAAQYTFRLLYFVQSTLNVSNRTCDTINATIIQMSVEIFK